MNRFNGKRTPGSGAEPPGEPAADTTGERRRIGRVVHDERGSASLEWRDAPRDHKREVLEIAGEGVKSPGDLSLRNDDSFNPYGRTPDATGIHKAPHGGKRDLKKLSAWLKMMRELEERKKDGDG